MKHFAIIGAMMAILMGSVSCKDNPYKRLELTTKSAEFARKGNDFAFNFIDRVNDATQVDFIISPLSMQFLLGMILDGAQGQTADEICSVLGYGAGEVDAVNEYCQAMLQQLPDMDKKTKLAIANAIVVNQKYQLLDSYKSTVGKYYDAEVANMDFDDNAGTTKKINKWCSDKTNGLVPEIIKNVNPYMFAYLMNAMYFKSEWKQKFPKGNTSSETFTAENGAKTSVQMMKIEKSFLYQDNDVMRVVRLPYGNGVYSMMVILPAEGKTIADVTSYLNGKEWDAFISNQVSCDVDLWLPKFETKFHIDLNDILSASRLTSRQCLVAPYVLVLSSRMPSSRSMRKEPRRQSSPVQECSPHRPVQGTISSSMPTILSSTLSPNPVREPFSLPVNTAGNETNHHHRSYNVGGDSRMVTDPTLAKKAGESDYDRSRSLRRDRQPCQKCLSRSCIEIILWA